MPWYTENAGEFVAGAADFQEDSRKIPEENWLGGMHDEDAANGSHPGIAGLAGTRYINDRCSDCHERNGAAPVAANGELLDRWVFKVSDASGNPHPTMGRVFQPKGDAEGGVSIAFWNESNGLRRPTYQFSGVTPPPTFSARIAPRLVGLGLLEAIPESTVLAKEDANDSNRDGISGRAKQR